mgnify:FL=1
MVAYCENYILLELSVAMLMYWAYKHRTQTSFSVLFADDNETLGKSINTPRFSNKKPVMPHLLDDMDPASLTEYGFIKSSTKELWML